MKLQRWASAPTVLEGLFMNKFLLIGGILLFSGVSMANSMVLPSVESLAGQWRIIDRENSCDIHLKAEGFEPASGYKLSISSDCVPNILPETPEAWRPTPDGIALLNRDGLTTQFFSREGEHYRSQIWGNTGKILERNGF